MRILMLTSSWPLQDDDYRGCFVREMALELARRGIFVDVAVPATAGGAGRDTLAEGAVVVHWLPSVIPVRSAAFHGHGIETNLLHHPFSAFSLPPALLAFATECSVILPFVDAIVSNWVIPMGAVGAALAGVSGLPHLIIAHSAPPAVSRLPVLSSLTRRTIKGAAGVACVSESVMRKTSVVAGPGFDRVASVIPLGVHLRPFVDYRESRASGGSGLQVLFAGRLVPLKGVDLLIRAVAGVPGCSLTVVGDGPELDSLRTISTSVGARVAFVGRLPGDRLRDLMCRADVLAVPSRRGLLGREEGMPRVIAEAWSVGLPVIASRTGGMVDAIESCGAGLLFGAGDIEGLRDCLTSVSRDRGRLSSLRERAVQAGMSLSWEGVGDRWADWVRSALNGRV
ncbi:MAG TPA: glycosyltransferase family 4 protein [Myxococcota bacterium]|nr:glycosyltransferase family 4 protein [Myxococcota bacterium]HQP95062.1 glycosyltransferase family 4 protein [Myxococcota bacterium]